MSKHRKRILINSSSSSLNLITWNCKQRKKIKGKPTIQPYRNTDKRNDMKKLPLKEQIKEAVTNVCQALNALQAIERQFDDDLVDDNGKNVEAEYYALRNAIASLKSAYEEIKDI